MIEFYRIEKTKQSNYFGDHKYRFRSLFNSSIGEWHYDKKKALEDGENHKSIIWLIYDIK